jgi:aspartate/methionine/tyrosine aminotransferase
MTLKVGRGASAPPFMVMDVIAAANARAAALPPGAPHVIRMEVGQPGTGAPAGAVAAAVAALRSGDALGYTEAFGRRSLRERIVAHYRDCYGLDVPIEHVAVTVGASGAFPLAFLAAFDRGDRVALAAPFYPPYVNILTALGMQPVVLEAGPETRFQPSVALLEALDPPPDGLIVASPCNPAGTMLHPEELAAIARWCDAHGVRLVSDEIYHGLHYDSPAASAASFSGNAVVVNSFSKPFPVEPSSGEGVPIATAAALSPNAIVIGSFSKYFSMTGWRIGWMVLPGDLVRPVERLAQNLFISAPHISQIAAEAAFDCHDELAANVARYRRSRDHLLRALPEAGFNRLSPAQGAFYLFADIADRSNDSEAFCKRMLAEVGVAASPGIDFDHARGNHFLRFSYCGPEADMREAAERLKAWR